MNLATFKPGAILSKRRGLLGESEAERLGKGATAGALGGLAGSLTMSLFQMLLGKISSKRSKSSEDLESRQYAEQHESQQQDVRSAHDHPQGDEPATVVLAEKVSTGVLHRPLTEQKKKAAGSAVHYGYGTLMGAVYGALAERAPIVTACEGTLYGSALWLFGDEIAVPFLKLSKPTTKYSLSTHVSAFAAHLVYGLTLEGVRRAVRQAL